MVPLEGEDAICVSEDGVELKLWFDIKTTWWASQPSQEDIKKHLNVLAHYVRADLNVMGIKADLADYIQSRNFSKLPTPEQGSLQAEYERLGQRMLKILLDRINRLVAYARARKGQY